MLGAGQITGISSRMNKLGRSLSLPPERLFSTKIRWEVEILKVLSDQCMALGPFNHAEINLSQIIESSVNFNDQKAIGTRTPAKLPA